MRIRSSRTLVFTREAGQIVCFNYLTSTSFACDSDLLSFLSLVDEWASIEDAASRAGLSPCDLETDLRDLIDAHALIEEGSSVSAREEEFQASWNWGMPAALFHLSLQDRVALTLDESEELQRSRLAVRPQPPLYLENDTSVSLKLPSALDDNELLQLMARRRTVRVATATPLSLHELSDCLFAGMGIIGETQNCVGTLPLSMTPSGGARNPYEAYVYARSVDGLDSGFYHYAAVDHTLERIASDARPKPSDLVGGQDWADQMPCVIFLCARLERPMWKYDDANAYRVVLIEAGHIGQNVMLAATRHGLSACPTAALAHTAILRALTIDPKSTHAPVYALTLGRPPLGNEQSLTLAALDRREQQP